MLDALRRLDNGEVLVVHASLGVRDVVVARRGRLVQSCGIGWRDAIRLVVLVEVVALEELLDTGATQVNLVLLDGLGVLPLLVVDVVLVEVDLVGVGNVRRWHRAVNHGLPIEVGEPGMVLYLCITLVTKAVAGLSC